MQIDKNDSTDTSRTCTPLPEWNTASYSQSDQEISNESAREEIKELKIEQALNDEEPKFFPTLGEYHSPFLMPFDRYTFKNRIQKDKIKKVYLRRHDPKKEDILARSYTPEHGPVPLFQMKHFYRIVTKYDQKLRHEDYISADKLFSELNLISEYTLSTDNNRVFHTCDKELWLWAMEHIDCIAFRSRKIADLICSMWNIMFEEKDD